MGNLQQSRDILQAARKEAALVFERSNSQARADYHGALRAGIEAGRKEAIKELLSSEEMRRAAIHSANEDILELVFHICEEVIGDALESHPESLLERIKRAKSRLLSSSSAKLVVPPPDRLKLDEELSELAEQLSLVLEEDDSLSAGEMKIETRFGTVKSSPATHLRALKQHFLSNEIQSN